jgi:tetratricopeptide (TPR) repeat protein
MATRVEICGGLVEGGNGARLASRGSMAATSDCYIEWSVVTYRDTIKPPLSGKELGRAIRDAGEWFVHDYGDESLAAVLGVALLDAAADDFERTRGSNVRRSVMSMRDVQRLFEGTTFDAETRKSAPKALADLLPYHHHGEIMGSWYRLSLIGPRAGDRGESGRGNYFLAVEVREVAEGEVPGERRNRRPGRLPRQRTMGLSIEAPTIHFHGRDAEVEELVIAFRRATGTVTIAQINGLPGIGKSQAAFAIADRLRRTHPKQIQLHAGIEAHPRSPEDLLLEAIFHLRGNIPQEATLQQLSAVYRALLHGQRALILCDNASSDAQVRALVPPKGSGLLVTSRGRLATPSTTRTLPPLAPQDGCAIIEALAPRTAQAVGAELATLVSTALEGREPVNLDARTPFSVCITRLCGHLPIALAICGAFVGLRDALDLPNFVRSLLDTRTRLALTSDSEDDVSVAAVFRTSYDGLLLADRSGGGTQKVFRALAILPHQFTLHTVTQVCGAAVAGEIAELVRQGLVSYDIGTEAYGVHELVNAFAAELLTDDEREPLASRFIALAIDRAQSLRAEYDSPDNATVLAALRRSSNEKTLLTAAQRLAAERMNASHDAAVATSDFAILLEPFLLMIWHDIINAWVADAWQATCKVLCDEARTARHSYVVGLVMDGAGEWSEAVKPFAEAYHLAVRVDDVSTASRALERLVRIYRREQRHADVEVILERKLALDEKARQETLHVLLDLIVRAETAAAMGDYIKATEYARQIIDGFDIEGPKYAAALLLDCMLHHPRTFTYCEMRYRNVLRTFDLGPEHGISAAILATAHLRDRTFDHALDHVVQYFATLRPIAPPPIRLTGRALWAVSKDEAYYFYSEAIEIYEFLGIASAELVSRLGRCEWFQSADDYEGALPDCRAALLLTQRGGLSEARPIIEALLERIKVRAELSSPRSDHVPPRRTWTALRISPPWSVDTRS